MPRKKKEEKYAIDFPFPDRSRDLLFKEDGSDRYTVPELLDFATLGMGNYAKQFVPDVRAFFEKNKYITSSQKWTLENLAAEWTPEWEEVNQKFFLWYDSRSDMQEMYKHAAESAWWFYDRSSNHHNKDEAIKHGWHERPDTWKMFVALSSSQAATRFRELKRDVVFDIGDQVVVRTAFKNSYLYDPCYGKNIPIETERIGMVVEHRDEIYRRSRGGKGSRLINVLWMNIGEQKAVPERILKKHRSPKQ